MDNLKLEQINIWIETHEQRLTDNTFIKQIEDKLRITEVTNGTEEIVFETPNWHIAYDFLSDCGFLVKMDKIEQLLRILKNKGKKLTLESALTLDENEIVISSINVDILEHYTFKTDDVELAYCYLDDCKFLKEIS